MTVATRASRPRRAPVITYPAHSNFRVGWRAPGGEGGGGPPGRGARREGGHRGWAGVAFCTHPRGEAMRVIKGQTRGKASERSQGGFLFEGGGEGAPPFLFVHGWCGDRG